MCSRRRSLSTGHWEYVKNKVRTVFLCTGIRDGILPSIPSKGYSAFFFSQTNLNWFVHGDVTVRECMYVYARCARNLRRISLRETPSSGGVPSTPPSGGVSNHHTKYLSGVFFEGIMPKRKFYQSSALYMAKRKGSRAAKRRTKRKSKRITRSKRYSRNMHKFVRYTAANSFQCAYPNTELDQASFLTFNGLVNYTEFTPLYDRYMITGIQYSFQLLNNPDAVNDPAGSSNTTTTFYPKLWWCPDYDDSGAEPLSSLYQRTRTRHAVMQPNREIKVFIKPAVLAQTYASATSTGYAPKWNNWIDMDQVNVPHYGLKWVFDCNGIATATGHPWYLRVETKVYFKCKDVR